MNEKIKKATNNGLTELLVVHTKCTRVQGLSQNQKEGVDDILNFVLCSVVVVVYFLKFLF